MCLIIICQALQQTKKKKNKELSYLSILFHQQKKKDQKLSDATEFGVLLIDDQDKYLPKLRDP